MGEALVTKARAAELLDAASRVHVAVIGDVMLDVYLSGETERMSPEAPVPIVRVTERHEELGGAANVAKNVRAIGAQCSLVGAVGKDPAGDHVRSMLEAAGIDTRAVISTGRITTVKTRVMSRGQQIVRYDHEVTDPLPPVEESTLVNDARDVVMSADALAFADYAKGALVGQLVCLSINVANARRVPSVADPAAPNLYAFQGATVCKPNDATVAAHGMDLGLFARIGAKNILRTRGALGMVLVAQDGRRTEIPALARGVVDVTGAGDTVTAYVAALLAAKATVLEAAVIANIAAGVQVGKRGAQTVTPEEVLARMAA